METINVRKMCPGDAAQMANLERLCFSDPWSENAFACAAEDANYLFLVAEVESIIVGMAGLIISFDEGTVTNVAVNPEHRKMGIARKVINSLMDNAALIGVENYTLEVRESNEPAIKLYESLGFENVGIRPGFYEHPKENAVVYWKYKK